MSAIDEKRELLATLDEMRAAADPDAEGCVWHEFEKQDCKPKCKACLFLDRLEDAYPTMKKWILEKHND